MANPITLDLSGAKTLLAFGERAAKHGLAPSDLQLFIDDSAKMARLANYAKAGAPEIVMAVADIPWLETYRALGLEDCWDTKLVVPERPELWVMPMFKGVTSNKVVVGHKKLGVNYYLFADDLDKAVPTHDRDANRDGSYAVAFRRNVEADEEFKNLSANQLAKQNHKGITLPERLLLGAGFYVATGQHLDIANWTLCAGSRDRVGIVPSVYWFSVHRKVLVYWYGPDDSLGSLRSRSVVS